MPGPTPERIGRYTLGRLLGEGGQGKVYEAVLHGPGGVTRRVALKLVAEGAGLAREARLGGLLRHPHLVDVYEVGEADGTSFLAMELCPDGTLASRIPLPPRAVVDVGLQVCAALQYAHAELGLVHLDLKPQNLLLDGPIVKVADLGVARGGGEERRRIEGTHGYMAPEQRRAGPVDARADIYALGVVLQELATAAPPASTEATLSLDGLDDQPAAPIRAGWLEPVLARCLAPEPADRFGSMDELARALRALDATGLSLVEVLDLPKAPPPSRSGTNLGTHGEGFVGRQDELAALDALLARPGLVTLKGPPGIGKTALARAAALRYRARTGAQAWFCDLSEARSLAALLAVVGSALDVPATGADDAAHATVLGHALAGRGELVVVLDNFEQAIAHAPVVARWVARADRARFLVTSRAPLRVAGEALVELGALDPPAAAALLRSRALRRGVDLDGDPLVEALAQRLDYVPLALELAAGRLGVLPLAEVVERLSLSLLRSGRAGVTDREATLRGALEWSWELLEPDERLALARLSVFRGGFTLEAAEAVLGSADLLRTLAGHSLVGSHSGRFGLLESVREFAAGHLSDPAEPEARHGAWYAGFGSASAIAALHSHGATERRHALAADLANVLVACRRAVARGDAATAVPTLRAMWGVVSLKGPLPLAVELADDVLAIPGLDGAPAGWAALVAALALERVGLDAVAEKRIAQALAHSAGDPLLGVQARAAGTQVRGEGDRTARDERLRRRLAEALALARQHGERHGEALVLANLGLLESQASNAHEALACFEAALPIFRSLGDRRAEGIVLANTALQHRQLLRFDEAVARSHEALAIHREVGDRRAEGLVLGNLGAVLHRQDELDEATGYFEAALAVNREVGNRRSEGFVLGNLGLHYHGLGQTSDAIRAFEAALEIHRELRIRHSEGGTLGWLASVLVLVGRFEEAIDLAEEALALQREVDGPDAGAAPLCTLGQARLGLGEAALGERLLLEAVALERHVSEPHTHSNALSSLGSLRLDQGRFVDARACFDEALAVATRDGAPVMQAVARAGLVRLAVREGAVDARQRLDEVEAALRASRRADELARLLCVRATVEHADGRPELARTALAEVEALLAQIEASPRSALGRSLAAARAEVGWVAQDSNL